MKSRLALVLMFILTLAFNDLRAQPTRAGGGGGLEVQGGFVTGTVVDTVGQVPLEYANIVLFDKRTGSQVDGTISHEDGTFRLGPVRPGVFDLEIKFMGFHARKVQGISLAPPDMTVDVGVIALRRAVIPLPEVEVSAERPDMVFKIDRKVINVDKQIASRSGTAVDVLENAPSVTVDIEGNVSLRGSSSFTVLIDSKPTMLEPSEALQQIPASTIDNIEIITNPSAKYDPDGVSGIINVITKKTKQGGISGIVNLNGGPEYTYGGDFLASYRKGSVSTYVGMDYSRRQSPGVVESQDRTTREDTTSFVDSRGDSRWKSRMYSGKGGVELGLTSRDVLSVEARGGNGSWDRPADEDYDVWTQPGDTLNSYASTSRMERTNRLYQGSVDYRHTFGDEGHEVVCRGVVTGHDSDDDARTELRDVDGAVTSGRRTIEEGPSTQFRLDVDYTRPLDGEKQIEAGYQGRFDKEKTESKFYEYETENGRYDFRPEYSHSSDYERDIQAVYALYVGALGPLGYQGGLRTEYVYRQVTLVGEDETFSIDRWDFFPTVHLSYAYSEGHQMMASYTRRINRPRRWWLEPFLTWSDAYNVQRGNPALKPEYIDSYELGYQRHFGPSMVSVEAYYRLTHNEVERVQSVYQENVILHTVENVGEDYTFGSEIMLNLGLAKWWYANLTGNLYDYRVEGTLYGRDFSEESFNWRLRGGNTFRVAASTRLQINAFYNSRTVTAQGERKGFYVADLGLKQDFMNRTLSLSFQVRDFLQTGKFEFTSEGPDFYSRREFTRKSPRFSLMLTYNFNNYKPEREDREELDEFDQTEEF